MNEGAEEKLWFYRHSDGYPEGAMPTINEFMEAVATGAIRSNISQAAGWLVYFGAKEYGLKDPDGKEGFSGWKVGAIEPTTGIHGDIEFLYELNLKDKTCTISEVGYKTPPKEIEVRKYTK